VDRDKSLNDFQFDSRDTNGHHLHQRKCSPYVGILSCTHRTKLDKTSEVEHPTGIWLVTPSSGSRAALLLAWDMRHHCILRRGSAWGASDLIWFRPSNHNSITSITNTFPGHAGVICSCMTFEFNDLGVVFKDNKDGTYTLASAPIKHSDIQIPVRPFRMLLQGKLIDATIDCVQESRCTASGAGLESPFVGRLTSFVIQAVNCYGNKRTTRRRCV
jgi:hypothetical protein